MKELTLKRLLNTNFSTLYSKLIIQEKLSDKSYQKLLSIAVILINQEEKVLNELGYRIVLQYSIQKNDYEPLYDLAIKNGLNPIVKAIDTLPRVTRDTVWNELNMSYIETYKYNEIYHSIEQMKMNDFFKEYFNRDLVVAAPTSYGKSELIEESIKLSINTNICIIVPTKSLLSQTKYRISKKLENEKRKVITHPDMYNQDDKAIVAILTQERLLRLLKIDENLKFDHLIIDEAHNLLGKDNRSRLLASTILVLKKRKNNISIKYLTPFIADEKNLNPRFTKVDLNSFRVSENIKSEKYYVYDYRNNKKLYLYDQFLNDYILEEHQKDIDDIDFILNNCSRKNIIYFNKPKDIVKFSSRMIKRLTCEESNELSKMCDDLSKFIHEEYSIIKCIQRGFVYHHGAVPDNIRMYIEYMYRNIPELRYIITNSTLLEGVNIPAEKLFLLTNKIGNSNLSKSQFKNLVGRVCRFSEIFNSDNGNLKLLIPEVYLVVSDYFDKRANVLDYVKNTVSVLKKEKDKVENVLLENTNLSNEKTRELDKSIQFVENFENGTLEVEDSYYAKTFIGKLCYKNNVFEIDISEEEEKMEAAYKLYSRDNSQIIDIDGLFDYLQLVFLPFISDDPKHNNIRRLQNIEAINFYKMILNWRLSKLPLNIMINKFLKYWEPIGERNDLAYVGRWGDEKRNGYLELWTRIGKYKRSDRINLAIVRIKEEMDFIDNNIIKYVEILNDLGKIDDTFYNLLKYGTSNKIEIELMMSGVSNMLAKLFVEKYLEYIEHDSKQRSVNIKKAVIDEMKKNNENGIYVVEAMSIV